MTRFIVVLWYCDKMANIENRKIDNNVQVGGGRPIR